MNLKASVAASLLGLLAAAACSSGSSNTTSASGSVAPAKWTAESKAGVRQIAAMGAQGPELDCTVDVITSIYSPEDWTYAVAHPGDGTQLPARMQDLEARSRQEMERRCGIKDTSAEDKANAEAMKAWNAAVEEWNQLTEKRDAEHASAVVVNGQSFESYDDWAKAFGKPLAPPN